MNNNWRAIQRANFTRLEELAQFLELPLDSLLQRRDFPLNLPKRLAEKIEKGNLKDPLLRQFVPLQEELQKLPMFVEDPVGDSPSRQAPRLLHKYEGRALLVTTSACAMHCRYCFRQHFDYAQGGGFTEELNYLKSDPSIKEVLLSGGDPLSLSNEKLEPLLQQLSSISHIERIRFHTRFPIGIPERIDEKLLQILKATKSQVIFVLHINHPKELDGDVAAALKRVSSLGIPLLNQTVLLRGVNDDVETLTALSETLINVGIIPYYLHQLDRVQGASHFEVEEKKGLSLIKKLRDKLPGYAIPQYVREIEGEASKSPV